MPVEQILPGELTLRVDGVIYAKALQRTADTWYVWATEDYRGTPPCLLPADVNDEYAARDLLRLLDCQLRGQEDTPEAERIRQRLNINQKRGLNRGNQENRPDVG